MQYDNKEVRYDVYCKICKNRDKDESEDPCFDCLQEVVNTNSKKPVCFVEDKKAVEMERRKNNG